MKNSGSTYSMFRAHSAPKDVASLPRRMMPRPFPAEGRWADWRARWAAFVDAAARPRPILRWWPGGRTALVCVLLTQPVPRILYWFCRCSSGASEVARASKFRAPASNNSALCANRG
ncbi:hypothetical protein Micbo1qcDRAFT_57401 [Microdochium bolleyi]|uniref:Uncharacterized protein n=1 Tax=Microdochium bolleyi TaxID=196109 RepID=A0A136J3G2_9PEZI|nr:hypothetical protein Micbo1qcDRAFT_57401 [Microdochium bolleyi]